MNYAALAFLAVAALAGGVSAQDQQLIRYSLDNGLDVILVPDHRVPKVVIDIAYKVGAINEPAGRTGFAHLFEHLMFSGTPAYPDIDAAYGTVGAEINASTWDDHTLYFTNVLASALPFALSVEADRMANQGAAITAEDLDIQRDVVLNEIRENVLDSQNGSAYQVARTILFPKDHPYSRSVYGSIADLKAATIEDVHQFFDMFYVPNNAILTLVGDFDVEATKALIADTFGRIPRGADVLRRAPTEVPPQRRRAALEDKTPTPRVILTWAAPPGQKTATLLRVANELLGNEEYGVLRRTLIDTGIANGAWSYSEQGHLATRFTVEVSAADGVDAPTVEAATRKALSGFLDTPLEAADVDREKKKILLEDRVANEELLRLADNILYFTDLMNDPSFALLDDPNLTGGPAADVQAATRQWLQPADASVVTVQPGDRGDYPPVLTASSGEPSPFAPVPRPHVDIPELEATTPELAAIPEAQTATLSNGIRVVHYDMPQAAMAYLAATTGAGTLSAPEGKEGITDRAAVMAIHGAGERGPVAFGKAAKDLGATFQVQADFYATSITLSVPPEDFGAAVDLFGDVLQRPLFDPAEWDTNKAMLLNDLAQRETDVTDVASRYALAALFPKQPGQPAIDESIASVKALTLDETKAIFPRMFSPRTVTFYSVGPVPLAEVVAALEKSIGAWTSDAAPLPEGLRRPVTFPGKRKVLLVPEPDAAQSAIYIATPAPGYDEAGTAETFATFRLLGEDFISRINSVIREDKGYTYGTDGKTLDVARTGSALVIEAPVTREDTGAALDEIFKAYASLATDPVRADEMERTVTSTYSDMASAAETSLGFFDDVWTQLGLGSTVEEEHDRRVAVTRLDLKALRKQAAALAALDRALIVVVGDADVVKPQLEALGLDVEIRERDL